MSGRQFKWKYDNEPNEATLLVRQQIDLIHDRRRQQQQKTYGLLIGDGVMVEDVGASSSCSRKILVCLQEHELIVSISWKMGKNYTP